MHIEAGVVGGAKMLLSYGTAVAVIGVTLKLAVDNIKQDGILSLIVKSILSTILVFCCFEVLPHVPVGISEVHLILGTTIFLIFGIAPAAIGLTMGLLLQGVLFAQFDLPQYGINVTTLLASMFMLQYASKRIIPENISFKDISYTQMLKMSVVWQGAIVSWVAFWAFYGQGFTAVTLNSVLTFGSAYMSVILVEPLVDLVVLAGVKAFNRDSSIFFDKRVYNTKIAV